MTHIHAARWRATGYLAVAKRSFRIIPVGFAPGDSAHSGLRDPIYRRRAFLPQVLLADARAVAKKKFPDNPSVVNCSGSFTSFRMTHFSPVSGERISVNSGRADGGS